MTQICIGKLSIIGSDNGLSPSRRQAIIWTNAGILLIGTLRTDFSEISIESYKFWFKKMHLKMSSGKWRPCCLGLNVLLTLWGLDKKETFILYNKLSNNRFVFHNISYQITRKQHKQSSWLWLHLWNNKTFRERQHDQPSNIRPGPSLSWKISKVP